jgi:hypothetical protein
MAIFGSFPHPDGTLGHSWDLWTLIPPVTGGFDLWWHDEYIINSFPERYPHRKMAIKTVVKWTYD